MRFALVGGLVPALLLMSACAVDTGSYEAATAADIAEENAPDPTIVVVQGEAPASEATRFLVGNAAEVARPAAGIHETVPVPPLELYPYILRTQEIHHYYMSFGTPQGQ